MGYMHIDNLYKSRDILQFKECYAMEKIHGTSAHISWNNGELTFTSGGLDHNSFERLFDKDVLRKNFTLLCHPKIIVYGKAYGGKIKKMQETYGPALRFVVFEIRIGECWLCVPDANLVADSLELDFVPWSLIPTTLEAIDAERDKPSIQAIKNGMGNDKKREGIVLRPPIEVTKNDGTRIIAKHKAENFQETKTSRPLSQNKFEALDKADEIANEWVTEMRLTHVLDNYPNADVTELGKIISTMIDDILREGKQEIIDSKEAKVAIARKTALMFKARLKESLYEHVS